MGVAPYDQVLKPIALPCKIKPGLQVLRMNLSVFLTVYCSKGTEKVYHSGHNQGHL